jgi:hypothetical protein
MSQIAVAQGIRTKRERPPRRDTSSLGMHVTKVGERVLQTLCGEFDSHRLQICLRAEGSTLVALSSNRPGNRTFNSGIRVQLSLALLKDLVTQWLEYAPLKRRVVGSNPTRVIIRLIAQWTELLPSKESVLGSNPSKAKCAPEADRNDAPCYERGDSWFNSNRGLQPSVGAMVAQIPYKDKVERSSRSRRSHCIVAQLAERLTVNQVVTGSIPVDAATEVIRPDEEPVLKTGARKGCRCESMPLPPSARIAQSAEQTVDNRSVESSNLSSCTIVEGRVASGFRSLADYLPWKQGAAGSIPATRTMRVRNDGHSAGLQTQQREFESHHVLSAPLRQGRAVSLKTRWIGVQVPGGVNECRPS